MSPPSAPPRPLPGFARTLGNALLLAVAYYVAGRACVSLPRDGGMLAPVWVSNAIALATLLRSDRRRWPWLVAGALAGNMGVSAATQGGFGPCVALGAANMLEYLGGALALRRLLGEDVRLHQGRDLVLLGVVSALAAPAAGVTASSLLWFVRGDAPALTLRTWLMGHPLALLMVTPCLLALSRTREHLAETPVTPRGQVAFVMLLVCALGVFAQRAAPVLFLIPPALLFVSLELGVWGAATGVLAVSGVAMAATLNGLGPVALTHGAFLERGAVLQLFLVTALFASLPVASLRMRERRLRIEAEREAARAVRAEIAAEAAAAAKAEFLANMSHELRTPLTAVLGFAGLVADQPELSADSRRYLDRVRVAGRSLLGTVNDILEFSRLEAGQVEVVLRPAALQAVACEALELFEAQAAAKGLDLRLEIDGEPPPALVRIDEDRVRQVLVNLIGNAVKFTERGQVRLGIGYAEGGATLAVADTGPGIAPEQAARLFQRFSQLDGSTTRRHGGSGLGLAICKGFVEAMGGTIGVESAPGVGSTFRVDLPAPVAEVGATGAALPPAGLDGGRVLLVDDTRSNRELAGAMLKSLGLRVDAADGGGAGVRAAERERYDLVLMDLRMPDMDGRTAASLIRDGAGLNARTPIVAFSSDVIPAGDPQFDGLLSKPISPPALLAVLAAHLGNAPLAAAA